MNSFSEDSQANSIAIVGISGRFPGAENIHQFWDNLVAGKDSISRFTIEEMAADGVDVSRLAGQTNHVPAGGLLRDHDKFDAAFFGIYPREAEQMDPQGRVILECAWNALEDAGYIPDKNLGPIGVYVGASRNTYFLQNLDPRSLRVEDANDFQTVVNNEVDSISTKISYKLNLTGPSVSVSTACSTSLVAVYQAVQSLLTYQCDMALAGGVSVRVPQTRGAWFEEGSIRSPDGKCRVFDKKAQGMTSSNGVGIVVLKRLSEAISDGDNIYAVIRGAAINNDGASKVGFAAPSVEGQSEAVLMAQAMGGVDPADITYVEAHGTATPLGDPIEIAGLTRAFRTSTDRTGYCGIGSVKSNIGHLDAAAGVTGLIKAVLSLQHGQIPPSLHFDEPNPEIEIESTPFYVVDKLQDWPDHGQPRIAAVSSFGVGGTNAHAILQEAPKYSQSDSSDRWQLIPVSARTPGALDRATENLANFFKANPEMNLADAAFTMQQGRREFAERRFVLARNAGEAAETLKSSAKRPDQTETTRRNQPKIAFMFPGQGSQHPNMGRELYETESTFRKHIDHCAEILEPKLGFDLRDVLYPTPENEEDAAHQIRETNLAQPAIFAVEYAMAKLWMERGVVPDIMLGHSIGEFTAACLAGVIAVEDVLSLLARRGRLMADLPGGDMLAVPLGETDLLPLIGDDLSIAAINSDATCVVAGPHDAVESLRLKLEEDDVLCRPLHTSHAFHSAMMDPILDDFVAEFDDIKLSPPEIQFISSPTGKLITDEQATDPAYWGTHLREAVRFADGRRLLAEDPECILIEVGPGNTLTSLSKLGEGLPAEQVVLSSLGHALAEPEDAKNFLNAMGKLWLECVPVSFESLHGMDRRRRVSLPGYSFERKRYWVEREPESVRPATAASPDAGSAVETVAPVGTSSTPVVISPVQISEGHQVASGGGSAAENVISQQLRLMSYQLALLANARYRNVQSAQQDD